MTRCGIVAVVGAPNAGKSTLLNRLVGQRLAIVSPRAQSTRHRVVGIVSRDHDQIIFTDTPGLMDPRYHLQRAMKHESFQALQDADVIAFLIDAARSEAPGPELLSLLGAPRNKSIVVVLNKTDVATAEQLLDLRTRYPQATEISAASGAGVEAMIDHFALLLPESPFLYNADDASTQSMRFFVCEAIREAGFEQLDDELPYSVLCDIDEYREGKNPVYIRATVYVERDSQKSILIGQGGRRIRELGTAARAKVEPLIGCPVYLDLWVKVLPNWRRNVATLQRFGFTLPQE